MSDLLQGILTVFFLFFAVIIALILGGCAPATPLIKTEYVRTPTHCDIKMPERPVMEDGFDHFTSNFAKILAYADQLEMALHCCRGDKACFSKNALDK